MVTTISRVIIPTATPMLALAPRASNTRKGAPAEQATMINPILSDSSSGMMRVITKANSGTSTKFASNISTTRRPFFNGVAIWATVRPKPIPAMLAMIPSKPEIPAMAVKKSLRVIVGSLIETR